MSSSNSLSKVNLVFQFLPNTSMLVQSECKVLTILPQFLFCLHLVIIGTNCGHLMKLVTRVVRQLAAAFNTLFWALPSMSQFHGVIYLGLFSSFLASVFVLISFENIFPSQFLTDFCMKTASCASLWECPIPLAMTARSRIDREGYMRITCACMLHTSFFTPRDTEHLWRTSTARQNKRLNICRLFSSFRVVFPSILLMTCAARSVHPRYTWSSSVGSSKSTFFCCVAHIFSMIWVFPFICMSPTHTDKNYEHFAMK